MEHVYAYNSIFFSPKYVYDYTGNQIFQMTDTFSWSKSVVCVQYDHNYFSEIMSFKILVCTASEKTYFCINTVLIIMYIVC